MTAPIVVFPALDVDNLVGQTRLLIASLERGEFDSFEVDTLATLRALVKVAQQRDDARDQWARIRDAWLEHAKRCPNVAQERADGESAFDRIAARRGRK